MPDQFRIAVLGNVASGRTEAEVYLSTSDTDPVALVYELESGWVVERFESPPSLVPAVLDAAIESAKETLSHYVNRTGKGAPAGLTGPGLSLWLMQRIDGTAMGRLIG